jgi:hypothetical protein
VAIALVLAIVKDVVNNMFWGETQLVLRKLAINRNPARAETPHLEISGRRAGLIGYLLTLFDLSPTVSLTANSREIRKSTTSLHGHSLELIPLSSNVSIQADSQRSLFWLAAAILSLIVGVPSGLLLGDGFAEKLLNGMAWVAGSGIFLFAYYQSHRFQIMVTGTLRAGVSFKPSVIEGRGIRFQEVIEAAEVLMDRIQKTRLQIGAAPPAAYAPVPAAYVPEPAVPAVAAYTPPAGPPVSPAVVEDFENFDETLSEIPFPAKALAAGANAKTPAAAAPNKPATPDRSNTGTVEYGEDQPAFEAAPGKWNGGPEPGTSDSIQIRQAISRSETGMFLGVPPNLNEYDDEELDESDTDPNAGTHRGTVAWEDQADKTQDEMRAEAELADLKRSRPKRGEAKLRLRELMRRFPQTEAALKARRMLERLESGE